MPPNWVRDPQATRYAKARDSPPSRPAHRQRPHERARQPHEVLDADALVDGMGELSPGGPAITHGMPRAQNRRMSAP